MAYIITHFVGEFKKRLAADEARRSESPQPYDYQNSSGMKNDHYFCQLCSLIINYFISQVLKTVVILIHPQRDLQTKQQSYLWQLSMKGDRLSVMVDLGDYNIKCFQFYK